MNIDIHEQKMKPTYASLYRPIIHLIRKILVTGSKQYLPVTSFFSLTLSYRSVRGRYMYAMMVIKKFSK